MRSQLAAHRVAARQNSRWSSCSPGSGASDAGKLGSLRQRPGPAWSWLRSPIYVFVKFDGLGVNCVTWVRSDAGINLIGMVTVYRIAINNRVNRRFSKLISCLY